MKKSRIAVVALAVLMLFAAVSCKDEPVHQHVFDKQVVEEKYLAEKATETSPAKYYLSCECGEKGEETFEDGKKLDHEYGAWTVVDATCTEKGSKTRKCIHEGCTEVQTEEIEALGHKFGDWTEKTAATCTVAAVESRECTTCHTEETRDGKAALGHSLDGEGKCTRCESEELYGAKIGTKNYKTLAAAVADASNGDTIEMLWDAYGDGIGLYKNPKAGQTSTKNLTIDFNGFTYTIDGTLQGSPTTETQAFHLEKDCDVTLKNGTLTSSKAKMLIQNYCNLTLDNMVLDFVESGKSYALSNNNGKVAIKDTTIKVAEDKVAFDVYGGFGSYEGPSVEITGNSVIDGIIEVDRVKGDKGSVFELIIESGVFNSIIVKDSNKFTSKISGGSFKSELPASLTIADGFEVKKNDATNMYEVVASN